MFRYSVRTSVGADVTAGLFPNRLVLNADGAGVAAPPKKPGVVVVAIK